MSEKPLIPLLAVPIPLNSPVFQQEIGGWKFADLYVARLLQNDIPQRVKFGNGRIWAYRDSSNEIVGFGTIDVCSDYGAATGNKPHPYIPLLAVNPAKQGHGHGNFIIRHLIGQAALLASIGKGMCSDVLFLDVYTSNLKAISLYERHGFKKVRDQPEFDPAENQDYFVMARRVSFALG